MTRSRLFWRVFLRYEVVALLCGALPCYLLAPIKPLFWEALLWFGTPVAVLAGIKTVWLLPFLRKRTFLASITFTICVYAVIVSFAFWVGIVGSTITVLGRYPGQPEFTESVRESIFKPGMLGTAGFALLVMAIVTFVEEIARKLGPGVLWAWLCGKYHTPRTERRVLMFVDLKGSTTIAESLGDLRFSRLIQQFLSDFTEPLVSTQGEVSHYVGDGALLSWKCEIGLSNAACLRFLDLLDRTLDQNATLYRAEFDLLPEFRAGAHIGTVVATQVGDVKSEIVFHGDAVNTAARIADMTSHLGVQFLLSDELWTALNRPAKYSCTSRGGVPLKGKRDLVNVHELILS